MPTKKKKSEEEHEDIVETKDAEGNEMKLRVTETVSAETTHAYNVEGVKAESESMSKDPEPEIPPPEPKPKPRKAARLNEAIYNEYQAEMDKWIKKALNKCQETAVSLEAQESPRSGWRAATDFRGKTSRWYRDLIYAVRDGIEPGHNYKTKEDLYKELFDLHISNMRTLDAIKQQYPF